VLKARLYDMERPSGSMVDVLPTVARKGSGDRRERDPTYNFPGPHDLINRINLTLYRQRP